MFTKNEIISNFKIKKSYMDKVDKINSCDILTEDEKELLINSIKLPINHTIGYYPEDDDPDDVKYLTPKERELYGI